jgi:Co/Zn/Cd efflux system component
VLFVAVLNLSYFGVEFAIAKLISSVSLYADSIDFLEDAAVNTLVFFARGWTARMRSNVGMLLAGTLLLPSAATLWTAWQKLAMPTLPDPTLLSAAGVGALAINVSCALALARFRAHGSSLTRAAYLSARNDAFANIAIICAGLVTLVSPSIWPDLLVGAGIFLINLDAAREVYRAANGERVAAEA